MLYKLEYWAGSNWFAVKNRSFQDMVFTSVEDAEYVSFLLRRAENMSGCAGDWRVMDSDGGQHYCRPDRLTVRQYVYFSLP